MHIFGSENRSNSSPVKSEMFLIENIFYTDKGTGDLTIQYLYIRLGVTYVVIGEFFHFFTSSLRHTWTEHLKWEVREDDSGGRFVYL